MIGVRRFCVDEGCGAGDVEVVLQTTEYSVDCLVEEMLGEF